MDVDKIILLIPQLLLLFIPGYIALIIKTKYLPQKKLDNFDAILYSILYSFIVGIVFELLRYIKNLAIPGTVLLGEGYKKQLVFLLLGLALGCFLTKAPKWKIGASFSNLLNKHLDVNTDVWEKAMRHPDDGAWATVYLKNGMIYEGVLKHFTDDPNNERKELILYDYKLGVRKEGKITNSDQFCIPIEVGQKKDLVYIQREDIIAIQVRPGNGQSNLEQSQSGQPQPSQQQP